MRKVKTFVAVQPSEPPLTQAQGVDAAIATWAAAATPAVTIQTATPGQIGGTLAIVVTYDQA